jgi:hypothetical protein
LARPALIRACQAKWDSVDTGRFAHLNFPDVIFRSWFEGLKEERRFVCTVSRVLELSKIWCVYAQVIMRQWTTWFGTVKESGRENIVSLMRLPRWLWLLRSPFLICVNWRSGVPWSVDWTSLESLGYLCFDDSAFLLYLKGWKCIHSDLKLLRSVVQ